MKINHDKKLIKNTMINDVAVKRDFLKVSEN